MIINNQKRRISLGLDLVGVFNEFQNKKTLIWIIMITSHLMFENTSVI